MPQNKTPGRLVSTEKVMISNKVCENLEEEYIDLYTVSELHNITRDGKSNIILLDRVADILSERWYNERKTNIFDESERVIRTVAKLLKEAIKKRTWK